MVERSVDASFLAHRLSDAAKRSGATSVWELLPVALEGTAELALADDENRVAVVLEALELMDEPLVDLDAIVRPHVAHTIDLVLRASRGEIRTDAPEQEHPVLLTPHHTAWIARAMERLSSTGGERWAQLDKTRWVVVGPIVADAVISSMGEGDSDCEAETVTLALWHRIIDGVRDVSQIERMMLHAVINTGGVDLVRAIRSSSSSSCAQPQPSSPRRRGLHGALRAMARCCRREKDVEKRAR